MPGFLKRLFGGGGSPRRGGKSFDAPLEIDRPTYAIGDVHGRFDLLRRLLDRIEAERAAGPELSRAETEIEGDADEGLTWRFQQVNKARHRAERPELEDSGDLNEDRDKLAAELSDALSRQIWRKPPRR
jgi:DNA primase